MRVNTHRNGVFSPMTTLSVSSLAQSLGELPPDQIIFGHSEAMQAVRSRLGKRTAHKIPILHTRESGTRQNNNSPPLHGPAPWKNRPPGKGNLPRHPGAL